MLGLSLGAYSKDDRLVREACLMGHPWCSPETKGTG